MHYSRLRLILAFLFIIIGIVLHFKMGIGNAWYLYVASSILIITHFKFGTVWTAFAQLNKGKLEEASDLLDEIKRPDWLSKLPRAYYHFTRGMIALQQKDLTIGESELSKSIAIGLRNNNDNALAIINLAHICYQQKRPQDALNHLKKAKTYELNDLMLKKNIHELEKALNYKEN